MSSLIILPAFILLNVCLPRLNLYVCLLSPSLNMMPFLCKSCSTQSNITREARFSAFCSSGFRCLFSSFYIENGKKGTYFSHPGVIPFFLPAFVIKCVCCVSPSVERFRFSGGPLLEHSLWHCIFFRVFLSYAPPVRVWKVLPGPVPIYQVAGTFGCIIRLSVMLMMSPAHSNTPA